MKRGALTIPTNNSEADLDYIEVWTSNVGNEEEASLVETQEENTGMRNNEFKSHVDSYL